MAHTQTTRLRESRAPMRQGAKIIDADFQIVSRRTVWSRIMRGLTAIFWAAAIGFAAPQIWSFATQVGVFLAQS